MTRPGDRITIRASIIGAMVLVASCSSSPSAPSPGGGGTGGGSGPPVVVHLIGAGDIGQCGRPEVEQTARLVSGLDGDVLLAGDIAYFQGTTATDAIASILSGMPFGKALLCSSRQS